MKCPHCNADTRVLQTDAEVRRRECFNMHRFNTREVFHDLREERREHLEAMQIEREAIRQATGTLRSIANEYRRSVSYVWKVRKATA